MRKNKKTESQLPLSRFQGLRTRQRDRQAHEHDPGEHGNVRQVWVIVVGGNLPQELNSHNRHQPSGETKDDTVCRLARSGSDL